MPKQKDGGHEKKAKKLYCSNCSSGITQDTKLKEDKNGALRGNCTCCKKKNVVFTDKLPDPKKAKQKKELAKGMEISEEEAIKENKKLNKARRSIKDILEETDQLEKEAQKRTPEILSDPAILPNAVKEIQKEVAGEEDTIIALILIATTRLVKNAIPESKNLLLSDTTGVGKDHVTKKTLEAIVPSNNLFSITKMSKEAFTYWHANEPEWTWGPKVIHLEDITQELLNSSTFKTMASGGSYAAVVNKQKTELLKINGKPVMILTSHHANLEDEALRRFPIGTCDDTSIQTERIFDKISRKYTRRGGNEPDVIFRFALKTLQSYSVVVPYAELIQFLFPQNTFMRTHYQRFLNYICASAVFHQHQRKKTEEGELIATEEDYMIARMVLIYTTSNPSMLPMSKEYRDILDMLQQNVEPMTINEMFLKGGTPKDWYYRNLSKIPMLIKGEKFDGAANKKVTTYQYNPGQNPNLIPTWNEIIKILEVISNKTQKTQKTDQENKIEEWFSGNKIKPRKPDSDEKGGVFWGFLTQKKYLQQKGFLVFAVFAFMHERDEKRYKKYYADKVDLAVIENREDKKQSKLLLRDKLQYNNKKNKDSLTDRLVELKEYCNKLQLNGNKITYNVLIHAFDQTFIENAKQDKLIGILPDGSYEWRGN